VQADGVQHRDVVVEADDVKVVGAVVVEDKVAERDPGEALSCVRVRVGAGSVDEARQGLGEAARVADGDELVVSAGCLEALKMAADVVEEGGDVAGGLGEEAIVDVARGARQSEVASAGQSRGRGRSSRGHPMDDATREGDSTTPERRRIIGSPKGHTERTRAASCS
jgi:hypothetical protein